MRSLLSIVTFLSVVSFAGAQEGYRVPEVIPPAPNAANLGKFVEVPVSLYTGIPRIDIPIWTVKEGKIELPISVNYHGGGIRVSELASWVGLGWSLSAGGMVSRSVLGKADESDYGYLNSDLPDEHEEDINILWNYAQGYVDFQPDMFFINFSGHSGRFVFDKDGNTHTIPKQNIRIKRLKNEYGSFAYGHDNYISGWEITAEDGIKYVFKDCEKTTSSTVNFTIPGANLGYQNSVNSWYLSSIVSPTGDAVNFVYEDYSYSYDLPISGNFYQPNGGVCSSTQYAMEGVTAQRQEILTGKRLSLITFSNGAIRFIPTEKSRADLIGDFALERIVIEDSQGVIKKQFQFEYGYLVGNVIQPYASIDTDGDHNFYLDDAENHPPSFSRRLMLQNIVELNPDDIPVNQGHRFEYIHDIGLPSRGYKTFDHWGYANYPEVDHPEYPKAISKGGEYFFLGKDPVFEYARQGTLYEIQYPTGGHTTMEYELNSSDENPSSVNLVREVPGAALTVSYDRYDYLEYPFVMRTELGQTSKHYYTSFTINDASGSGKLEIALNGLPESSGVIGYYIENVITGGKVWSASHNGSFSVVLMNGNFRLYHNPLVPYVENPGSKIYCSAEIKPWLEEYIPEKYSIGGLRIAKITTVDPVSHQQLRKVYSYRDNNDRSTGELLSMLTYSYGYEETYRLPVGTQLTPDPPCFFTVFSSSTVYPMSTTQGNYVGYSQVVEKTVDSLMNPLGKSEYTYLSPYKYPDMYPQGPVPFLLNEKPFPPVDNRDWCRGQLLSQKFYSYDKGQYKLVKKIVNEYYEPKFNPVSTGAKFGFARRGHTPATSIFNRVFYKVHTGNLFLYNTEVEEYYPSGTHRTSVFHDYSTESLLPIRTTQLNSDGSETVTCFAYPLDYPAGTDFIDTLTSNNIVNVPIETVVAQRKEAENMMITSGNLVKYSTSSPGDVAEKLLLEIPAPLSKSGFKFSSRMMGLLPPEGARGAFSTDIRYNSRIVYDRFDKGRILQFRINNTDTITMLWSYNNTLPVVKGEKVDYNTLSAAVESALPPGYENLEDLLRSLSEIGSSEAARKVWAVFNKALRMTATLKNAYITTITYDPLLGMTSQTDPNGITLYYHYDDTGRLQTIKDQGNNMIKNYKYQYQTQDIFE